MMNIVLVVIMIVIAGLVSYTFRIGYPKYGWFKSIIHDKWNICEPDLKNHLIYDEKTKIVQTECKFCKRQIWYHNVCKHLVYENPKEIPNSVCDPYCRECMNKNYTKNRRCCPHTCGEFSTCRTCERDWSNE